MATAGDLIDQDRATHDRAGLYGIAPSYDAARLARAALAVKPAKGARRDA